MIVVPHLTNANDNFPLKQRVAILQKPVLYGFKRPRPIKKWVLSHPPGFITAPYKVTMRQGHNAAKQTRHNHKSKAHKTKTPYNRSAITASIAFIAAMLLSWIGLEKTATLIEQIAYWAIALPFALLAAAQYKNQGAMRVSSMAVLLSLMLIMGLGLKAGNYFEVSALSLQNGYFWVVMTGIALGLSSILKSRIALIITLAIISFWSYSLLTVNSVNSE